MQSNLKSIPPRNYQTYRFVDKLTFGTGFYAGVYASQNYELPRVDDPSKLYQKLMEYLDQYRKK